MDKKIKGCSDKVVFRTPGPPISMLMRFCFLVCAALWFVLYLRLGSRMMRNIEIGGTGGLTLSILWFYCPSTVSGGARIPGQNIFKCFFCNTWALIHLPTHWTRGVFGFLISTALVWMFFPCAVPIVGGGCVPHPHHMQISFPYHELDSLHKQQQNIEN